MFPLEKFSLSRLLTGIILLSFVASCGSGTVAPTATPVVVDEPTVLPVMPTADASVQSGTPIPAGAVISVENAASLTQLARWGQGTVKSADYSSKIGLVAVGSPFGVILYDAQTLAEVRALPTNGPIRQVLFSPDGSKLAALGEDKAAWLWQVADGTLLRWINNFASARAGELFFSPDSSILAIPTGNTLQLRRTSDGALLRTVTHEDLVSWGAFSPDGSTLVVQPALGFTEQHLPKELWKVSDATRLGVLEKSDISAYSPDGSTLAGSDGNTVTIWQGSDSKQLNTIESPGFIMHLGFSADGSTLVTTSWDKTVRLWKVSDGTLLRTLEGHTDIVNNAVYSPDGLLLASASDDKTVKLWRVSDGTLVKTLTGHTQPPFDLLFSPDGSALVSRSRGDSFLWRVSDGTLLGQLNDSFGFYFSPDSSRLISSYPTVKVWQVKDGALLNTLNQYGGQLSSIAFSKNSSLLLSNSTQGVRLWRVNDGALLHLWETPATSIALSPDGSTVAFGMNDSTLQVWRISDKELLQTLKGHAADVWNVAFSADGAMLASVSSDGVRLWKMSDGSLRHVLDKVYAFDFSSDSSMLVSASNDGVRLWRVSDGQLLETLASRNPPSWVSFAPEGSVVAAGSADAVQLWQASDGKLLSALESQPTTSAFSPDGSILSLGLPDGSIELHTATDGTLLRTLKGHTGILSKLIFSPDSSILVSASRDGTVRLWKVSDGSLLKTVEVTITGLTFSPDGTLLAASLEDGTIRLWGIE
jgi:WD40 repeat protein